ncbi:MAG TPA: helix-turn-helix domain-containing protein [Candidatus Agathobaculum intestinipullorum]|nr:helix-turn-helix domain-containing protein [Candidatus Agathobaculum intestinipullorum]
MTLGEKITDLRKKRSLSQEDLAITLGVSRQAVSKWEVGVSHN